VSGRTQAPGARQRLPGLYSPAYELRHF